MIGLIAKKNKHYFIGKWRSNENRSESDNFKFRIISGKNEYKTDSGNMRGTSGNFVIGTRNDLDFKVEDFVYWRGMRFNITEIDTEINSELAYSKFNYTGMVEKILKLRFAGNE